MPTMHSRCKEINNHNNNKTSSSSNNNMHLLKLMECAHQCSFNNSNWLVDQMARIILDSLVDGTHFSSRKLTRTLCKDRSPFNMLEGCKVYNSQLLIQWISLNQWIMGRTGWIRTLKNLECLAVFGMVSSMLVVLSGMWSLCVHTQQLMMIMTLTYKVQHSVEYSINSIMSVQMLWLIRKRNSWCHQLIYQMN